MFLKSKLLTDHWLGKNAVIDFERCAVEYVNDRLLSFRTEKRNLTYTKLGWADHIMCMEDDECDKK